MSELAIYLVFEDEYHSSGNSSMVMTAFDSKEKATAFCEEKQTWLKKYKEQFPKMDICVEWRVEGVTLQRSEGRMKPEDRRRLKQHIEMIVEHKMPYEDLESENKSLRHILSLWRKTEAQKEIDRLKEEIERLKLALKECGGL